MTTPDYDRGRVAWSPRDWCRAVSVSPAHLYELIQAGKVRSAKVGGKRLVITSPRDFVERHAEKAA